METLRPVQTEPRSVEEFSQLANSIYGAATQPEQWNEVVGAVGNSMGAKRGMLFTPFVGPQDGGYLFTWNWAEHELSTWATQYIEHDVWAAQALEKGMWKEGIPYIDSDIVATDEFRLTKIYKEFFQPMNIEWLCCGAVFEGGPGLPHTALSYFRGHQSPPFDSTDKAWLRQLLPHISRSLGFMHRLNTQELNASSLRTIFDRVGFGIVLLNAARKVMHLNQTAHEVLARNDGLLLGTAGELSGAGAKGTESLQTWLERVGAADESGEGHFNDGFLTLRSELGRYYLVQYSVMPDVRQWGNDNEGVRYVLFVTDPYATQLPPVERLQALYCLTKAEARIALELASGNDHKTVARRVGATLSTVRTQIQSIFKKMRIHRNADLVRVILSLGQVRA